MLKTYHIGNSFNTIINTIDQRAYTIGSLTRATKVLSGGQREAALRKFDALEMSKTHPKLNLEQWPQFPPTARCA